MRKILVKSDRFLNFGKQKDGTLLYFRKGEVKSVPLTPQIAQAVDVGLLQEVVEEKSQIKVKKVKKSKGDSK